VDQHCAIEFDANSYSVPWRLIGETVLVVVAGGRVSVRHAGRPVAIRAATTGRRQRVNEPMHFTRARGPSSRAAMPGRNGSSPRHHSGRARCLSYRE